MNDDFLEFKTRFSFGKFTGASTIVEMDYSDTDVCIYVRESNEREDDARTFFLDPQEIDLFIAALTLYKHRILNPKRALEK